IGSLFGKFREGADTDAAGSASPVAIQRQLGEGVALDPTLAGQFGAAMGADFSGVRVHNDPTAAALSDQLDARAFTIGRDVAFGRGEYQPGTMIGDALLAHELAHVAQQSGSVAMASAHSGVDEAAEESADITAVNTVARLWGNVKDTSAVVASNALPAMRSGLRLQRCGRGARAPAAPAVAAPTPGRNGGSP